MMYVTAAYGDMLLRVDVDVKEPPLKDNEQELSTCLPQLPVLAPVVGQLKLAVGFVKETISDPS